MLHKIRNDIIAIKPSLVTAYNTEELLYRLYDSLPTEYATTVAVLKSNEEKDEIKALRNLQEMEDSLKNTETDLYARHPQNTRQRSASSRLNNRSPESKSSFRPPSIINKARCYICDEEGHKVQECDAFEAIKDLVRTLKKKKVKKVTFAKSTEDGKKPQKAYRAESESSNITNDDEEEEVAYLIKEVASKLQPFSWIADTGASSHMTNKINLFSGPLTRIKRRIIKVEGGVLHTDHMKTVILRSRLEKEVIIKQVYYVPDLGANLLSCRRLYMLGLKGRFDIDFIYLQSNNIDVLKADHKEEVYVYTWISKKFPS